MKNGAEGQLEMDLLVKMKEQYPHVIEMMDDNIPDVIFDELAITAYTDSNHVNDKLTWRSITGLVIFIETTPVMDQSKRQGAIETSAYDAEFIVIKTAKRGDDGLLHAPLSLCE
eukprot:4911862-Ditylum_brightwellii.AAC.1